MIFIDANVLLDVIEPTTAWSRWSSRTLAATRSRGPRVANAVVFAECAAHFADADEQIGFFDGLAVDVQAIPPAAAFRAGRAHRAYRRAGGTRQAIIADFLIGGHAALLGAALLTRDRARFATYFPGLTLITPETHP